MIIERKGYIISVDIIESKIFTPAIPKAKRKVLTRICKISFLNEGVKHINVPHVSHDLSVKACLPTDTKFDDPTNVYSFTNPVRSKIFNFNKFFCHPDVKDFLQENTILPCMCADCGFIEKDHRGIVTGDLRIVGNNKLKTLFIKDPKYKETNIISWE